MTLQFESLYISARAIIIQVSIKMKMILFVLADYNNDGIVDSTDVSALRLYLLSKGVDVSSLDVKIEAYVQQGLISMEAN